MNPPPISLPPALHSELLSFIVNHCIHPTTLIICSSRSEFLGNLPQDAHGETHRSDTNNPQVGEPPSTAATQLVNRPLYQVAVARHIRMLFVPTVSHLRALLAIFTPRTSKVPPPPEQWSRGHPPKRPPLLVVYGFLDLHRDTSEWNAQGLNCTGALLVEAGMREGFQAAIVEPRRDVVQDELKEAIPVLNAAARRAAGDVDEGGGGWMGRTVQVRRVLARWFRFRTVSWSEPVQSEG